MISVKGGLKFVISGKGGLKFVVSSPGFACRDFFSNFTENVFGRNSWSVVQVKLRERQNFFCRGVWLQSYSISGA